MKRTMVLAGTVLVAFGVLGSASPPPRNSPSRSA